MQIRSSRVIGVSALTIAALCVADPAFAKQRHTTSTTTTATSSTSPTPTSSSTATSAPTGQSTVAQALPAGADVLATSLSGWQGATAPVTWAANVGHSAVGSLSMTASGLHTSAASPTFSVTPGARYGAEAWTLSAASGHQVVLALRFYDSTGKMIPIGTVVGEASTDNPTTWTRTFR